MYIGVRVVDFGGGGVFKSVVLVYVGFREVGGFFVVVGKGFVSLIC